MPAARLELHLLGRFSVSLDGEALTDFSTEKARALLAYLAVEQARPLPREHLAGLFWPEQPEERARHSLRQALSSLRQSLGVDRQSGEPWIVSVGEMVQLNQGAALWTDAGEVARLAGELRSHPHRWVDGCLPCLHRQERIAALSRGPFLDHFAIYDSLGIDEWLMLQRERLHRIHVAALDGLAAYHERRGELEAALDLLRRQLELDAWREEAHRDLMRLLALAGERSLALAQYEDCRRILQQELGVEPTAQTMALAQAIKNGQLTPPRNPGRAIPAALAPLVGRAAELAELGERLADAHNPLLSVAGAGGVGKTRLAREAAFQQLGLYPDGVYWVALGALTRAAQAPLAVAQAVGLDLYGKEPPAQQLAAYLRSKRLLLVLDGAEHLPGLEALIAEWLAAAPEIRMLVTSRQRLALREECVFWLEGLPYPPESGPPEPHAALSQAGQYPAVELFLAAARRATGRDEAARGDLPLVYQICRLVEGLPLALEMAAGAMGERQRLAGPERAASLDGLRSALLNAPPHQESLRATCKYSWNLLNAAERSLFAGLAVLQDGFEAQAALQISGAAAGALDGLARSSMIRRNANGRYQLHGLLRQFAAEKLQALPHEQARLHSAQAAYYAALLERQAPLLKDARQELALQALDLELPNLRQAWEWALEGAAVGDDIACARLAQALEGLYLYISLRSWYHEGASLFGRAAQALENRPYAGGAGESCLLAELLTRQARCLEFSAHASAATALYERALGIFRSLGCEQESALPLYGLGYMTHIGGDYGQALRLLKESLALYRKAEDRWSMANVLSNLCLTTRRQGDFEQARMYGLESLAIRQEIGDRRGLASSYNNLGLVAIALGEYEQAGRMLAESLEICRSIHHPVGAANALTGLVQVAVSRDDLSAAAQYQQQALEIYKQIGDLWGVAIAYNNLGEIALREQDLAHARGLFRQAVDLYRQVGIHNGLANGLNNLGHICLRLGEVPAAAGYLRQGLEIAWNNGDWPILLEILIRAAQAPAPRRGGLDARLVLAFALQHPALLDETRRWAEPAYRSLAAGCSAQEQAAIVRQAKALAPQEVVQAVGELLDTLRT